MAFFQAHSQKEGLGDKLENGFNTLGFLRKIPKIPPQFFSYKNVAPLEKFLATQDLYFQLKEEKEFTKMESGFLAPEAESIFNFVIFLCGVPVTLYLSHNYEGFPI